MVRAVHSGLLCPATGTALVACAHNRAELVWHLAVFRRQRTARDRLPEDVRFLPDVDVNPMLSRAVGRSRYMRAWLVPGESSVCLVERLAGGAAGA